MFAIIHIGGKQYKVHEKDELDVEKIEIEEGKNIKVKEVLLVADEDAKSVKVGTPFVSGAHVECKVLEHGRGVKLRIQKFKAKKRYSRVQGHRQPYTKLKILKISSVTKKVSAPKKEETKKEE